MGVNLENVPVRAWGFQNLISLWVPTQRKVPVMAWDFQNISKPYFFVGAHPKNRCQLWHGAFKILFLSLNVHFPAPKPVTSSESNDNRKFLECSLTSKIMEL